MSAVTIRDVRALCTAPARTNLIMVKVETSEPDLYGWGCATFAYRPTAVADYVETYLKPLLVGRDVSRIEDLWSMMNVNAYWRNGPVANNAISGVDIALWDIKGKMANMPAYDLLGGKCREAVLVYRHASGKTPGEVVEKAQEYLDSGVTHVRCQLGGYGLKSENNPALIGRSFDPHGDFHDPAKYVRDTISLFAYVRKALGDEVELLHDVHERIPPIEAVRMAKRMEPFNLFFLEDSFSPEQADWLRMVRAQCSVPIALGELFNNPLEWRTLVAERLLDFIRVHISQIGGITPARKLAVLCETFGVRTAWHGPPDVSPFGHVANLHLDLSAPNFGIQEWSGLPDPLPDIFSGLPEQKGAYVYVNDKPGLGIDVDEAWARKFPCNTGATTWTQTRQLDGSMITP